MKRRSVSPSAVSRIQAPERRRERRRPAQRQHHPPVGVLDRARQQLDRHHQFHQQHHRDAGARTPQQGIDRRQDDRRAEAGIAAHDASDGRGQDRRGQSPVQQQRGGSLDQRRSPPVILHEVQHNHRGVDQDLPGVLEVDGDAIPATDWTCPIPQSGRPGRRTRMPGSMIAVTWSGAKVAEAPQRILSQAMTQGMSRADALHTAARPICAWRGWSVSACVTTSAGWRAPWAMPSNCWTAPAGRPPTLRSMPRPCCAGACCCGARCWAGRGRRRSAPCWASPLARSRAAAPRPMPPPSMAGSWWPRRWCRCC